MIINDTYRYVFIHIPKNAGTFVRRSIERISGTRIYYGLKPHHEYNILDESHMPLSIVKQNFPEEYKKILNYNSFAIVRDPFSRFPSSFQEYLRTHKGINVSNLTRSEIINYLNDAIRILDKNRGNELLPIKLVHFQKQIFYVNYNHQRIIKHLYSFENCPKLLEDLARITQVPMDFNTIRHNHSINKSSVLFRNNFFRFIIESNRPFKGNIMVNLSPNMQRLYKRMVFMPIADKNRDIFTSGHVQEFIKDYYKEDIELFNELLQK